MLLTLAQIKSLVAKLEGVRRDSGTQGAGAFCETPNRGPDGETFRWEPKPRSRRTAGHPYPGGAKLEDMGDGRLGVKVSLGVHGRAYLAVDPASGEVWCAKCEGKATA